MGPIKIKTSKACVSCAKAKLRCDKGRPCGRCAVLPRGAETCFYPPLLSSIASNFPNSLPNRENGGISLSRVGAEDDREARDRELSWESQAGTSFDFLIGDSQSDLETPPSTLTGTNDVTIDRRWQWVRSGALRTLFNLGTSRGEGEDYREETGRDYSDNATASSLLRQLIAPNSRTMASLTVLFNLNGAKSVLPVAQPMPHLEPPISACLPPLDVINAFITFYFDYMDEIMQLLHRGRANSTAGKPMSRLLLISILLFVPHLEPGHFSNKIESGNLDTWDRRWFSAAQDELLALLAASCSPSASPTLLDVGDAGALFNLSMWAFLRGHHSLSRQLLAAEKRCLVALGLVDSNGRAVPEPPWTDLVEQALGPDWLQSDLQPWQRAQLRKLWIGYWESCRVTWTFFTVAQELGELRVSTSSRAVGASFEPIRPTPIMDLWKLSFKESFDARSHPPHAIHAPPLLRDLVGWIQEPVGSPSRIVSLAVLPNWMSQYRGFNEMMFIIFRTRIDEFLNGCRNAGLESPGLLDSPPYVGGSAFGNHALGLQRLRRMRAHIDSNLLAVREALGHEILSAFAQGDARRMVEVLVAMPVNAGGYWVAWNRVLNIAALLLLRIELYTSFGVFLSPNVSRTDESAVDQGKLLAKELAAGDEPLGTILQDIMNFTRLLDSWFEMNPSLWYRSWRRVGVVLRVCVLHISIHGLIRENQSGVTVAGNHQQQALHTIAQSVETCLKVLEAHARKAWWCNPAFKLADSLWKNRQVSVREVEEATIRMDRAPEIEIGSLKSGSDDQVRGDCSTVISVPVVFDEVGKIQRIMDMYAKQAHQSIMV